MTLLTSTGSFVTRRNGRDHTLIPKVAPLLRCDGLELMMYDTWYEKIDQVAAALSGLTVPVVHCDKMVGEKISLGDPVTALADFKENCRLARLVGAEKLVLHLWNGIPSDWHFERNLNAFGDLWRVAEAEGLLLTVENVVCGKGSPLARMAELQQRYPFARFTFDTKMAAFHRELDAAYEPVNGWLWQGPVAHIHINDFGGGYKDWANIRVLHPGEGWIDLPRAAAFLKEVGYEGTVTSEAGAILPDGTPDLNRINRTLDYYSRLLKNS